jgi:hypothetical protein
MKLRYMVTRHELLKSGAGLGQLLVPAMSDDVEAVHQKYECTSSEWHHEHRANIEALDKSSKIPFIIHALEVTRAS